MSKAKELADRARAFEKRASETIDLASREHYREMAAHYRALAVEHREAEQLQKLSPAEQLANRGIPSFHNSDRPTYLRAMAVGIMLCVAFVAVSFSLRPQPADDRVLVKADRLMRTAGDPVKAR